jgi:hypothetical protein
LGKKCELLETWAKLENLRKKKLLAKFCGKNLDFVRKV